MPRRSMLLILSDTEERTWLATGFSYLGFSVSVASGGLEGLKLFSMGNFDVVLTDLEMPGLSGSHVAQFVRTFNPATLILGLSSNSEENAFCCDHILRKSHTGESLLERVRTLVTRYMDDTGDYSGIPAMVREVH